MDQTDAILVLLNRLATDRLRRDLHRRLYSNSVAADITYSCEDWDIVQGVICVG